MYYSDKTTQLKLQACGISAICAKLFPQTQEECKRGSASSMGEYKQIYLQLSVNCPIKPIKTFISKVNFITKVTLKCIWLHFKKKCLKKRDWNISTDFYKVAHC